MIRIPKDIRNVVEDTMPRVYKHIEKIKRDVVTVRIVKDLTELEREYERKNNA